MPWPRLPTRRRPGNGLLTTSRPLTIGGIKKMKAEGVVDREGYERTDIGPWPLPERTRASGCSGSEQPKHKHQRITAPQLVTRRASMVVNWSIHGQLIDQLPMAVVVVNCPPFKGALTACHPHQRLSPLLPQWEGTQVAVCHALPLAYQFVETIHAHGSKRLERPMSAVFEGGGHEFSRKTSSSKS